MSNFDDLPEHGRLLGRALAHFHPDDRVVGLVLSGSLAHGSADFYSDVDLYIVVGDGMLDAVFAERDVAAEVVGDSLFRFEVEPVPGGSRDYIVTYGGPVKFDFMYYQQSEVVPDRKWIGCPILKDSTRSMETTLTRSAGLALHQSTREVLLDLNQRFWTWCWYVFGKIMRGELWEALDGLHSMRSLAILPLLDWVAERPHESYRRLELKVDPETADRLTTTVASLESEALYAALQSSISLFRDLRAVMFDREGLIFDPAPEETLASEMSRRWFKGKE